MRLCNCKLNKINKKARRRRKKKTKKERKEERKKIRKQKKKVTRKQKTKEKTIGKQIVRWSIQGVRLVWLEKGTKEEVGMAWTGGCG